MRGEARGTTCSDGEASCRVDTRRAFSRPGEDTMRHNARHQRTLVLSMFLASVPKLRWLSSQKMPDFRADLLEATD